MKNNLILLGILIALLTGTYFLQEKKDRHNYVKMNEDEVIFKGPIQEISWDHFEAKKLNRNWKHGDQLLSAIHFGKIEKSIKGLRKIKSVDGEINKIFSNPFELRINGQQFLFGNLTLQQDGFYVAQDKSIFIATFDEDILHSENENPDEKKLNEFLSLFPTDTSSLIERQFFRYYVDSEFDKIKVHTDGAQEYELDFLANKSIPAPISGIKEHENLKAKFLSLFTQIMIKRQIEYPKTVLFKKMSEMDFFKSGGEKLHLELWLKSKSNADAIILDPINKKSYEMIGGSLKTFFIHLQDYWDKKVIPPSLFKNFDEVEVLLNQGKEELRLKILNREPLQFKAFQKIKDDELRVLFTYILNLGEKDQADRVSQISSLDKEILNKEQLLGVTIWGQKLFLWKKREELIIVNLSQGFKAHFGMVDEKFPVQLKDVIR